MLTDGFWFGFILGTVTALLLGTMVCVVIWHFVLRMRRY